jgi:sRNA-binding regulator protein Hfq
VEKKQLQGGETMSINCRILRVVSVMVFGAFFIFASSGHADTIYLKDGTMIKGAVKSEDEKTILIETGDTWKRVDKSNIETMTKDTAPAEKQADTNVQAQQSSAAASQRVTDLRLKFGSAAQIEELTEEGLSADLNGENSRNIQVEVIAIMYGQSNVGLLLSAGFFGRQHSGSDPFLSQNTIDYDAFGFSLGIGMGIKASDNLHFEGKAELGLGSGNAAIKAPGQNVGSTDSGGYASFSLIAGAYYTFSKPGFQLGLELGAQTFKGKFTYNNFFDEEVEGSSGTANLVVGYRF